MYVKIKYWIYIFYLIKIFKNWDKYLSLIKKNYIKIYLLTYINKTVNTNLLLKYVLLMKFDNLSYKNFF